MKFTNKDIRCFIITRNRPQLVQQALKSLLAQEGGPFDIWVIDNSTNEETKKIFESLYSNIKYIKHNIYSNTIKLQELLETPYALTLHDDDVLAPEYLQNAIKILNYYQNVSGVFSKYKIFRSQNFPQDISLYKRSSKHYLIDNQADFALSFWDLPSTCWTGSILKSDLYKNIDLSKYENIFGKIFDWPMLIDILQKGKAIIFANQFIWYRNHKLQDSQNDATGITAKQLANWVKFFKHFADAKKELKNIYITKAYECAFLNYSTFLLKKEQKNYSDLTNFFVKENLNIPPMNIYNKTYTIKILKPIRHLLKRIYKRNYFKQYLRNLE